ncbi:MAG: cold shock domain-containing protein [Gammaproteobacteria bacterium]|nr:cold shock domain-containing protein [Gammaproteobacteria bacterium]
MKATVKKWFRDKEYGIIENGSGPEIVVRKVDLIRCQYLKVGAEVEFECHLDDKKLIAKKVTLIHRDQQYPKKGKAKTPFIGVMK